MSENNDTANASDGKHRFFQPSANGIVRFCLTGFVLLLVGAVWALTKIFSSPYYTRQNIIEPQPVMFSHKHHVADDGIDCRYCHATVEKLAYAGMPATETCMNCHSVIWTNSEMLAPVRASFKNNEPLRWTRVHNLPEFVYFNHSIHVAKGVGCATCHGRVDQMSMTYQAAPLTMEWCLACHREPEKFVRPRDQVFNMEWQSPSNQNEQGRELVSKYRIKDSFALTNCWTCHR